MPEDSPTQSEANITSTPSSVLEAGQWSDKWTYWAECGRVFADAHHQALGDALQEPQRQRHELAGLLPHDATAFSSPPDYAHTHTRTHTHTHTHAHTHMLGIPKIPRMFHNYFHKHQEFWGQNFYSNTINTDTLYSFHSCFLNLHILFVILSSVLSILWAKFLASRYQWKAVRKTHMLKSDQ